jgi:uncharacterized linocin/CFP29 family protein
MNHLHRDLAPISADGWAEIDGEAKSRLTTFLAARRLVDFDGPRGWAHSAYNLGRTESVEAPGSGIETRIRRVQPLVELRVPFKVSRSELADLSRGADDVDLADLDAAVRRIALAENVAVFHGYGPAAIVGITQAASADPVAFGPNYDRFPTAVAVAVRILMDRGIAGPFGLALSSEVWTGVAETTEHGGYPLLNHLQEIIGGPVVWAPGIEGGIVLSQRGGDFTFHSGQDLSIGYLSHDADTVQLYLEESFTFRVGEPDAAVALKPAEAVS